MRKEDVKLALQFIFSITKQEDCSLALNKMGADFEWENIYNLFKAHDLTHLFAYLLQQHKKLDENAEFGKKLVQDMATALYRYSNLEFEKERVKTCLNKHQIPFILLKGVVMRKFYKEPWLRTSSDVDVLVKEEDFLKALTAVEKSLNCTIEDKAPYDVSMHSKGGVRIEIHSLIEGDIEKALQSCVWQTAQNGDGNEFLMSNEFFYFYHLAHMARHFKDGGCGIRPFIDLLILTNSLEFDREKVDKLLLKCGLKTFETCALKLASAWQNGNEVNELSKMEEYVLYGGSYGTLKQFIAVRQQNLSKAKYLKNRIFMPYSELKKRYVILEKHKCLTPFYEVVRWIELLKPTRAKRSYDELKKLKEIERDKGLQVETLLKNLGLK